MEQWEGNFPCDNHYEIKIDLQSKYFPNINQFRVFKRVAYLSRDNLYEISKYLHRIIFQSDIGAETGNSLYIYYTKLPMLAQLPSFLKRRKRRGRKKEARHKPNNRAPTPFQLCRIQADDPPRPRVIASILPIISRELMQRYRPFPPLLPRNNGNERTLCLRASIRRNRGKRQTAIASRGTARPGRLPWK